MAGESFQMLNFSQQQSADIYQRMDRQLTQNLQIQQQSNQAVADMALKSIQFAEQKRVTDARLIQAQQENAMRARQFELEEQMIPLKLQTAQLQFETQRANNQRALKQDNQLAFNAITRTYDQRMGSIFAATQDPAHMRAYLDLKASSMTDVMNGAQFDDEVFSKKLEEINAGYPVTDISTTQKPWSAEVSYLMNSIDPNLGKEYNTRNPQNSANLNALSVSAVQATDGDFAEIMGKFGNAYPPEILAQVATGREVYKSNRSFLNDAYSDIQKLQSVLSLVPETSTDPDEISKRKSLQTRISELTNDYNLKQTENRNLISNLSKGIYSVGNPPIPPEEESNQQPRIDVNSYLNETSSVMGVEESGALKQRLSDVAAIFSDAESIAKNPDGFIQDTELRNINLSWFEQNATGEPDPATLSRIKTKIEDGVEATGINGRFEPSRINKILGAIQTEISIPVSKWLVDEIAKADASAAGQIFGLDDAFDQNYAIRFGGKTDMASTGIVNKGKAVLGLSNGIASFEAMKQIVDKIPTKAAREEAKKELYSAATAAALGSAVYKK